MCQNDTGHLWSPNELQWSILPSNNGRRVLLDNHFCQFLLPPKEHIVDFNFDSLIFTDFYLHLVSQATAQYNSLWFLLITDSTRCGGFQRKPQPRWSYHLGRAHQKGPLKVVFWSRPHLPHSNCFITYLLKNTIVKSTLFCVE